MKRLFLFSLALAATCAASAHTVIDSKILAPGYENQIVQDQKGRIFKKLVKPNTIANEKIAPTTKIMKAEGNLEETFYEGFEGWEPSYGINWIPENWKEINTEANIPSEENLSHNVNNTWFVYTSSNMFQELTTDGEEEAFIHFGYVNEAYGLHAEAQDEWLVSPVISLKEKETLHFMLQADFFNLYNCTDFDWTNHVYKNGREVVNTMKIMLSTDNGETWSEIWDLVNNVVSHLTDQECFDNSDLKIKHYDIDLSEYAGKNIQLAWRYVRDEGDWKGNSMILDGIFIKHPASTDIQGVSTGSVSYEYYDVNGTKLTDKPSKKGLYLRKGEGKTTKVML